MGVSFSADFNQAADVIGRIEGVAGTIQSKKWSSTIVKSAWAETAKRFNPFMDALARSNPRGYHHVYEWGNIGGPRSRLWDNTFTPAIAGVGTASFMFRPSVKPIPPPKGPPEETAKLSGKKYYFYAKASVMEYQLPVTIKSHTPDGKIYIPAPDTPRGYLFVDQAYVRNPGGNVGGNFTRAFVNFFSTQSGKIFDETVRPRVTAAVDKAVKVKRRTPSKKFALMVDTGAASAAGEMDLFMMEEEKKAELVRRYQRFD